MVPALNLLRRRHICDAAYGASTSRCFSSGPPPPLLMWGRPGLMAHEHPDQHQERPFKQQRHQEQDEHREHEHHREEVGTSGISSDNSIHEDWLQLGLGPSRPAPAHGGGDPGRGLVQPPSIAAAGAADELDLDLYTDRPRPSLPGTPVMQPVLFLRPAVPGSPPASMAVPMPRAGRPWSAAQPLLPDTFNASGGYSGAWAGNSSCEMIRLLLPPPSPATAAGIWFALRAAQNQRKEPFLPQIPRSYLRIKDGRMTVRLLIKYLVNKFGLEDESEVEITCRGRPLPPLLTLQHVRDNVWCLPDADDAMPVASHIMILQYGRRP